MGMLYLYNDILLTDIIDYDRLFIPTKMKSWVRHCTAQAVLVVYDRYTNKRQFEIC